MSRARTVWALSPRIWLSSAAGIRISQSSASNCWLLSSVLEGSPTTDPVWRLCSMAASGSMPSGLWMAPRESLTAMIFAPACVKS